MAKKNLKRTSNTVSRTGNVIERPGVLRVRKTNSRQVSLMQMRSQKGVFRIPAEKIKGIILAVDSIYNQEMDDISQFVKILRKK